MTVQAKCDEKKQGERLGECPRAMREFFNSYMRYRTFAPFVRQTGERKAQTCANGMFRQLSSRDVANSPPFIDLLHLQS